MMLLYLVRHGHARPEEEDPKRALSDTGRKEIRRMAEFAAQDLNINVKLIIHSGKTRALQTAEELALKLSPSEGLMADADLAPMAATGPWVKRLNNAADDIMIVGHLPHLAKLVSALLYDDEKRGQIEWQTGGIVCLGRDDSGGWSLKWTVDPAVV